MKGQSIWSMLWLIIVVVVTLMVIVLFLPLIGKAIDSALGLNDKFQAMELASAVALTQAAPDGFFYTYDGLPQSSKAECAKIYKTYVRVGKQIIDVPELSAYNNTLNLTSLGTPMEPAGTVLSDHQPIVVDCKPGLKLVFRKDTGKVVIEAKT